MIVDFLDFRQHGLLGSPTERISFEEAMLRVSEDAMVLWYRDVGHLDLAVRLVATTYEWKDGELGEVCLHPQYEGGFYRLYTFPTTRWICVRGPDAEGTLPNRALVPHRSVP